MLVDTQRSFTRICFARDPRDEDLAALGGLRDRWLLYRDMVRTRLRAMLETALKRTVAGLGQEAWGVWFERWLDEAPPRTRYIREIVPELLAFALPRWEADASIPPWLPELARLEATRWEMAYLDAPVPEAGSFAFEKVPVLHPTLRLLRLRHPVHREQESYEERAVRLCVYRRADDRTVIWPVTELAAGLLEGFQAGDRNVTEVVQDVAAQLEIAMDQELVQTLGGVLAELLERGVLLGAR